MNTDAADGQKANISQRKKNLASQCEIFNRRRKQCCRHQLKIRLEMFINRYAISIISVVVGLLLLKLVNDELFRIVSSSNGACDRHHSAMQENYD